jgi:hypothetical protein
MRGSRGIAPLILNLGNRWRRVVNSQPRYSRKRIPVPTELEARLLPVYAFLGGEKSIIIIIIIIINVIII